MSRRTGVGAIVARAGGAALVMKVCAAGLTYLLHILLARIMGPAAYGDYIYALAWVGLLSLFCTSGFDTAALRFIPAYTGTAQWGTARGFIRRATQVVGLASFGVTVLYLGGLALLRGGLRAELVIVLALAAPLLPVTAFLQLAGRILQALRHVVLAEAPSTILRPLLLGSAVVLLIPVWRGVPPAALVISLNWIMALGALGVMLKFVHHFLPEKIRGAEPAYRTREWVAVGLPLLLLGGMHMLIARTDLLMVGAFMGTAQAGIYAVGARTAELTGFGLLAVNTIAAPLIAEQHARGESDRLQRTVTLAARASSIFAMLVAAVLVVAGPWILGLFGAEFRLAYVPLLLLVGGQVVSAFVGSVGYLMTMTGNEREVTLVVGGAAVFNVLLNFLLIPRYGLVGAAIATAVSLSLWNIVLALQVRRRLQVVPTALGPMPEEMDDGS